MIGALRGTVESITDQTILLMVNGVGYELAVPAAAVLTEGQTIQLYTYLAVRETALDLYGFSQKTDKDFFELLLTVPKIGPKSALQIMTNAPLSLLLECIQTNDPGRLHKMAGIGKKTCENMVTNLRDKVDTLPQQAITDSHSVLSTTQMDAIDALISLGYDPKTARDKVSIQNNKDLTVSDLVAAALK